MSKAACFLAYVFLVACGDSSIDHNLTADASSATACPQPLPADCPAQPPSYQDAIVPLIQERCLVCHGPGGKVYPAVNLSSYDHAFAQRTEILSQVYNCRMPPSDGEPLTVDELNTLLSWLVCGAPNN